LHGIFPHLFQMVEESEDGLGGTTRHRERVDGSAVVGREEG
jgi:hypothetical protein